MPLVESWAWICWPVFLVFCLLAVYAAVHPGRGYQFTSCGMQRVMSKAIAAFADSSTWHVEKRTRGTVSVTGRWRGHAIPVHPLCVCVFVFCFSHKLTYTWTLNQPHFFSVGVLKDFSFLAPWELWGRFQSFHWPRWVIKMCKKSYKRCCMRHRGWKWKVRERASLWSIRSMMHKQHQSALLFSVLFTNTYLLFLE